MGNEPTKYPQQTRNPPNTPAPANLFDPRSPRINRTPIQNLAPETPITNEKTEVHIEITDPRSPSLLNRTPIPAITDSPGVAENVPVENTPQPEKTELLLEEIDLAASFKRKLTFTPSKNSPTHPSGLDKENVPNESDWMVPKYHRRLRNQKRHSVSPTTAKSARQGQGRSPLSSQRLSCPVTQNSPTMKLRNL